jgi:hypothetical protein
MDISYDGETVISLTVGEYGTGSIIVYGGSEGWETSLYGDRIVTPKIVPSDGADFAWEYDSTIKKTILVQK